jgi:hypothetical protein
VRFVLLLVRVSCRCLLLFFSALYFVCRAFVVSLATSLSLLVERASMHAR